MSDLTRARATGAMSDYPCCECCLTDPLHPDRHEVSCPTCNNPAADRLRTERDALAAAVEHYAAQRQEMRALLSHVAERLDAFTYDELAAIVDDEPLDQWGERYRAQIGAERDALAAKLAHMTEARDNARAEVERLTARMESVEAGRETEQTMIRNAVAQLATVREWIDRRGVDVSDRDGAYWDGYRAAQRHALLDALELRRALDGETTDD